MADRVREPIQVYLTSAERERLDRLASAFGISRSEVLRRGLTELDVETPPRVLRALADSGLAQLRSTLPGTLPVTTPVATTSELMAELADDRADR